MAKAYVTAKKRQLIEQRARNRCEYCKSRKDYASHTFNVEHIIPLSANGTSSIDNLALACSGCNGAKSSKLQAIDPLSKSKTELFHPRRQNWQDHFLWSPDGSEIIGTTPIGRATVVALRLNRPGVVNLRQVMLLADLHPPKEDL